jgi:hypothetical protein
MQEQPRTRLTRRIVRSLYSIRLLRMRPDWDIYLSWAQFCGQTGGCTLLSVGKKTPTQNLFRFARFFFYSQKCTATSLLTEMSPR